MLLKKLTPFICCLLLPHVVTASPTKSSLEALFESRAAYTKSRSLDYDSDNPSKKGNFGDISPEAYQIHAEKLKHFLKSSHAIDKETLEFEDQISNQIFQFQLSHEIARIEFEDYLFPMLGDMGFYFHILRLGDTTSITNEHLARFYLEQLQDLPRHFQQWIDNMNLAIKKKKHLPAITLVDFEKPLQSLITDTANENPLYKPVANLERVLDSKQARDFQNKVSRAINEKVQPAVKQLIRFLTETYIPTARDSIAISEIPNGIAYYQSKVDFYTTINISANEVHQIGLREVARIRKEMDKVIKKSGFDGNFSEFIEFLRTDPQFYAKTPLELLKEASYISKQMDTKLPQFFTKLPRQPYAVEPVPEAIAPRYTTGRYVGAPIDSTRAGAYWVNTYALEKRPLYVLEALTLHEAVPGHHLTSALFQELEDLPDFRKNSYLSAFGEGWALYCEKLGIEAGFYQDHYSQFGRLTYEMWRAIRLVVDTGMHVKGWSRDKAIKMMEENTALSTHNVRTEIDRYIAWPGQALSYKMGEIKILELRALAENELGKDFDIRRFHDEILAHGSVPLAILEQYIKRWILAEKTASQKNDKRKVP